MARRCGTRGHCGMKNGIYNDFFGTLSSSSELAYYVAEDGNGVGTEGDPFGPSEFTAALASIPTSYNIYFKRDDVF